MEFVCRVGTPDGRVFETTFEAPDERGLHEELEKRGYHLFEAKRKGLARGLALPALTGGRRRIKMKDFLVFNQELATLLKAGLPLLQALDMMLERAHEPTFRTVLADIRDRVASGADLSEAFAVHGDVFPRLYPSSLRAGERSGELEAVIRRFIRYQRLMLESRRRVVSALVYPMVLIVLSIAMLSIMVVYVVPRFRGFYADLEGDLPAITEVVLAISDAVRANVWLILGVLVVAAIGFRVWSRTPAGRQRIDAWKLKIPLVGSILHRLGLSEFTRSLGTLLAGGLPLVQAFEIAAEAVGNASLRERIKPKIQMVREGKGFWEALEATGVFNDMAIDMIKVGESTGSLDEMLTNVSEFFDEEVETQLARILTLIEPAMLVVMGVVIGVLLIALYLPMFTLISSVG